MFKRAVKHESKLRLAIAGPSGSGKTYTSLAIGTGLGKVAFVDTESGSASKYADIFEFDVIEVSQPFHPSKYIEAIRAAANAGYDVIVLDSLSHAWAGEGGVLTIVDEAAKRNRGGNSFVAWKDGTKVQNQLIEAIVTAPIHVIGTMRSKTEYTLVTENGKTAPRKMGMAPVQRDGLEYEFDIVLDIDIENTAVVSKSRCSALAGAVINRPGKNVAEILREWLSGAPAPVKPVTASPSPVVPQADMTPLDLARQIVSAIKNPTLGEIAAELITLELYKHDKHVLNAVKQYPFSPAQQTAIDNGKFTFTSGQAVATKTGLDLFDWLVARKDEATQDEEE